MQRRNNEERYIDSNMLLLQVDVSIYKFLVDQHHEQLKHVLLVDVMERNGSGSPIIHSSLDIDGTSIRCLVRRYMGPIIVSLHEQLILLTASFIHGVVWEDIVLLQ
jgi:hypothetical protein